MFKMILKSPQHWTPNTDDDDGGDSKVVEDLFTLTRQM